MTSIPSPLLLTLADQRLPAGGHVHSGGVEEAITVGRVRDVTSLGDFLLERLRTSGLVGAGLAAAASRVGAEELPILDAEADARMPSATMRAVSRTQGRGLLRVARSAWAAPSVHVAWSDLGDRPHHAILVGCCAQAAGLGMHDAALVMVYQSVTGAATAAQRLLALDPISVAVLTMHLDSAMAAVAQEAVSAARGPLRDLPDLSSYTIDRYTESHPRRGNRLFAS